MSTPNSCNNRFVSLLAPSLRGGGAERVIVTLANAFAKQGIKTDLVVTKAEGPYINEVSSDVRIVDLNCKRVLTSLLPLSRYLRKESPDVMLVTPMYLNVIASWAHILSRSSTRLVFREAAAIDLENRRSSIKGRFIFAAAKLAYQRAHAIIGVSDGVAEDLKKTLSLSTSQVFTVYNPIDVASIVEKASFPLEIPLPWGSDTPFILGVGRLSEQKDFATLIKAFGEVRQTKNVKLVILGEGDKRKDLEDLIRKLNLQDHVWMPGFVSNPFPYLKQARLFVLSSLWEGLPNVLIQALVCGTPVIATDCHSGPREILENGRWGDLVPLRDSATMAKVIKKNLDDVNIHINDTQRFEKFSLEKITDEYLAVLYSSKNNC